MPWLRYHYHCEACDGTWLVEAEAEMHADCKFCGTRDIFPYRSDRGRIGRAQLSAIAGHKNARKPASRAGKLKRSA